MKSGHLEYSLAPYMLGEVKSVKVFE
jgi:hypothetical protein